jgi:6-phosphogluconolactonase
MRSKLACPLDPLAAAWATGAAPPRLLSAALRWAGLSGRAGLRPSLPHSLRPWILALTLALTASAWSAPLRVYLGTFSGTGSKGIYLVEFDPANGSLSEAALAASTPDPAFLVQSPDGRHLYAVNEREGTVSAFGVEPRSGRLIFQISRPTGGIGPAHIALDPTGRMLIITNYGGGSVCTFRVGADGSLGERAQFFAMSGPRGPNAVRQSAPHPHSATFAADGRFAYVCDLGLDRVFAYRTHPMRATMTPADPPFGSVPPGAGARHSVLSGDGRFLYVVNELGGSVSVFQVRAGTRTLALDSTVSTLPPAFGGENGSAEIQLSADGRFLYASNRGPDSIAVLARNGTDGRLTPVEIVPCGGRKPRNFSLSPDGRWVLCANQDSASVTVLARDPATGRLTLTGNRATVPQPVCVLFAVGVPLAVGAN